MPITKENYGVHQDVHVIQFGVGDILMTKARETGNISDNILCFSECTGHEIGEVSYDFKDKNVDELPKVDVIMRFDKPESITALIHSLIELQKCVFENQTANIKK